jgi:hypothetical protein
MKNHKYKNVDYSVSIEVERPPGTIFNHLIDLSKWWPEDFVGEKIALNSEFVLKTGEGHFSKNKVIEFEQNRKVAWVATESLRKVDNYNWTGSKFIFEVIPQGKNTQVKFTYDGVVFEVEHQLLTQICDKTVREIFYNFINSR